MRLFLEPGFSNATLWEAGVPSGSPHCGLVMGLKKKFISPVVKSGWEV